MWGRLQALIVKEFLAILRDRQGRMILIVPPLIQLVIFAFAATLEVKDVSIGVLDQDHGKWSYELVQRFAASRAVGRIVRVDGAGDIRRLVDTQKVLAVIQFPQGFSANIAAGRPAQLQFILDGRRSNAAQIFLGYANTIVDGANRDIIARRGAGALPSVLVQRSWFNPNLHYQWFTVPSLIGTISLLIGLSVSALSIAREREMGTFDQLLITPLAPFEILMGKTVPSLMIGLMHGTFFLLISVFAFHIPYTGSLLLLYASMSIYLVSVIGIGLFISALSMTQQQAFLGSFVFAAPAILLSGFASPVENMPDWLQTMTLVNPLRHFLVIVNGLFTKDMPFATVMDNTWPLIVIAVVTMTVAGWLFRRRMQ
ncbi:ABC transporter permease [Varunaivibrio sulfuroxidans]|uniref:Transport permease protein n=1 Tax=Varunaivibrio sulfuroxidans TaxID=1773489 RepID=A0A4R3J729_9PROT|nr:ABC transporter permease [Varunaivibrio sulfuroxidans]TCS60676.1 ABC-2 type transport system permease protein [Varunaivibrio sulfuroxidans]WES30165.1 ABC transporter permease [Varunaivibrio sulfuroxidans]